jgi:flagellin
MDMLSVDWYLSNSVATDVSNLGAAITSYQSAVGSLSAPGPSSGSGNDAIDQAIADIETSLQNLRGESKNLSVNLGVLSARKDFTNAMGNVLSIGADNLVNADLNEEAANMLALSTQQSFGVNALSLASQAGNSILRLLG